MFENKPLDEDTRITSSTLTKFSDRDVCSEKWNWDGIQGNTAILLASQFEGSSNEEIASVLSRQIDLGDNYNVSRPSPEYIFVNYGFQN